MKLVKLLKIIRIMVTRTSTNQVTHVMILDIANIIIKNNMTIMISELTNRHKVHGQVRNKGKNKDMKRVTRVPCLAIERDDPSAV
jgi:hypothetical protein